MPLSFPLDQVPGLPNQAVGAIIQQVNKLISSTQSKIEDTIKDAVKLPFDCGCDDPRIEELKKKLADIQELITKIQEVIPIVDKILGAINTLMGIANAIKAMSLLTPVVGQAALMAELVIMQNMTLANSGIAVKQLGNISPNINASLEGIANSLAGVVNIVGSKCGGETFGVSKTISSAIDDLDYSDTIPGYPPGSWLLISGSGDCGSPIGKPPAPSSPHTDSCGGVWLWSGTGYDNSAGISVGSEQSRIDDATMGTEFYTETNIDVGDLKQRLSLITKLVDDQQDLLSSLQEAPAQSYSGNTAPEKNKGKLGDYYIDTTNKVMYGPKNSQGWPVGINY
tara:strand:+ start:103 stop:1119 length:1017 start_codon:yes stop_codon:yes gene_type:complete